MSDGPSRLLTLSVLGGALHGKKVDVDPVDEVVIGSDPGCSFQIDLPGIGPVHAGIRVDAKGPVVCETRSPGGVFVNFDRVEGEAPLREGDMVWLGPPQEPGSVLIQARFGPSPVVARPVAPAADGFGEFVVQDEVPAAAAAADSDFVVAGFDAQWPGEESPAPAPPPAPVPESNEEDAFFIGDTEPPPPPARPAMAASEEEDGFFIADEAPAAAETPEAPLAFELPSFPEDELFVEATAAPAPVQAPAARVAPPPPAPVPPPVVASPSREPAPESPVPVPAARAARSVAPNAEAAARRADVRPGVVPARRRADAQGTAAPPPRPEVPRLAPRPAHAGAPARRSGSLSRYALLAVGVLALGGALVVLVPRFVGVAAELRAIEPTRARIGQTVALSGKGFAPDPQGNVVLFGDKPGTVVTATADRLEAVVPEVVTGAGQDVRLSVRVRRGRAESNPVELAVFAGPTLHGISPDVAMPGDEVVLAGVGWRLGADVHFGPQVAEVLEVRDTSIRVRVPPMLGGPGTSAPVVVSVGGGDSNPAPFFIGRVPLVMGIEPPKATPGDLVTIRGRGFHHDPLRNAVVIGKARALILSAFDDELKVVVPNVPAGDEERPVEVRVAGSDNVGETTLAVPSPAATPDFHFVAEPFDAAYGKTHALLATELGPAFVVAASGGRTAAVRAVEAQRRLNEAAVLLKATRGLTLEVRTPDTSPALALVGRPDLVLEVGEEDAAAYNEDWTGLRGRGGVVTRTRLARWWEAVAKDLVLVLVRNERPEFAAALAPEGRVLGDLFQAAQKGALAAALAKPATHDAIRLVAFRVPAAVPGLAAAGAAAPAGTAPAAVGGAPLRLEGVWIGTEKEESEDRDLTATFKAGSGSMSYEGRVTLTVPFLSVEQPQKNTVRFSLQFRGGMRYYSGRWDGLTLSGTVARDPQGKDVVGPFTLRPR